MLHRLVNDDHRQARISAPTVTGSGGWARVTKVNAVAETVEVVIDRFDGGVATFGPVPYKPGETIAVDELVWLLVDSAGEPGAVLKF